MEATRRSAMDRSREPGTKKPRFSEETERDRGPSVGVTSDRSRPVNQTRPAVGSGLGNSRIRASEREDREDVGRGGASHHHQQELLEQYRMALSELTFNSKVIITNLTIIAGENLDAAKSIAATVCENILEVPSEQKLPSLYLLDSIVKNIGKDYVEHFAARLPQVFCKAYRQVDPSIHHSLRHLFGTWKVVFPLSCLQVIEDELGFQSIRNGSSGGSTGTRSDSEAQRPAHSIHVNPKYLEARQQLQQSTKGKETCNEDSNEVAPADSERFARAPSKQWPDLSNKVSNTHISQREQPTNFINERKSYKVLRDQTKDFVDRGTTLDQIDESDEPNKSYYEADVAPQSATYRRNGFDSNHAYGAYKSLGSTQNDIQVPSAHLYRKSWPMPKNWKASEEEEYIWDDLGSRVADYERANSARSVSSDAYQSRSTNLKSHNWMSMDTEQIDPPSAKFDSFQQQSKIAGTEDRIPFQRDREEHYSQHNNPRINKTAWPLPFRDNPLPPLGLDRTISGLSGQTDRCPTSLGGIMPSNDGSVMPMSAFQSTLPSSLGSSIDSIGSGGVLGQQRLLSLRSSSPTLSSTTQSAPIQQKVHYDLIDQDYIPTNSPQLGQKYNHNTDQYSQKIHTSLNSQPSPSSLPTLSSSSSLFSERKSQVSSLPTVLNDISAPLSHNFKTSESKSRASSLLAALLKAKVLREGQSDDLNVHPPLPSGPPPTQALTSPDSLLPISKESMSSVPLLRDMLPPLPPGPPPSSLQTTNLASIDLNPLSSLLNSLVAKGLITSASTQLPTTTLRQSSKENSSQNSGSDRSTSTPPLSSNEFPISEPSSSAIELHNLIGTQFKPEIIREFHSSVIDSLIDDLKHQCPSCGLRFRHQGQLFSHLDWHNSTKLGLDNIKKMCWRWYPNIEDWVSGDIKPSCGLESVISAEAVPFEDDMEPMVSADERQCICGLCGEPFEDFYSIERDEWMYKGTIYLNLMDENGTVNGPIVHSNCFSASALEGDDAANS